MSNLSRWNPFKFRRKKSEQKQQEASRGNGSQVQRQSVFPTLWQGSLLDDPFFRAPFAELDRWFGDFSPTRFWPTVDVVEEKNAIRVSAELPGMDQDDVEVSVDDGVLFLRGEKRNVEERDEDGCYRTERSYGFFHRAIPLPENVKLDDVDARFDKGVLTVRLPMRPMEKSGRSRSIPIR